MAWCLGGAGKAVGATAVGVRNGSRADTGPLIDPYSAINSVLGRVVGMWYVIEPRVVSTSFARFTSKTIVTFPIDPSGIRYRSSVAVTSGEQTNASNPVLATKARTDETTTAGRRGRFSPRTNPVAAATSPMMSKAKSGHVLISGAMTARARAISTRYAIAATTANIAMPVSSHARSA
jgi:hypothetical protein